MSFAVQSRLGRFLKYHYRRRNQGGLVRYSRARGSQIKRWAMVACWVVAWLYMLEMAVLIASVSTGCRTCN